MSRVRVAVDTSQALVEAAAAVTARLEEVFEAIDPLRAAVEERLMAGPGVVASAALGIEPLAHDVLADAGGLATGAGFVSGDRVLRDRATWLEWWTVDAPGGEPARVSPELAPDGTPTYDYSATPWMVVPRETGRRHVTGPYVDYFCTTEYALTFTVPVSAGGTFGGVAGVDVPVAELERAVAPVLDAVGAPVALVNAGGRVVTSVDFGLLTGDLVRDTAFADLWAGGGTSLVRCGGDLPLGLLTRA